jgi:hypothetical protein
MPAMAQLQSRDNAPRHVRATLTLPAAVADALAARAARNFRTPKAEAVAVLADRLRRSGELRERTP